MHSTLQQQQKKMQCDHPGGRLASWNTPNIPAIKTEPREASPQPFNLYRAPSEMTPSPQPLSPSNNYNHPNTPSPYNMAMGGNTPLMSPNQQYRGGTGGGGVVPPNADPTPTPLEMHNEYNAYGGGQQHQQPLTQPPHQARHYVRQHQLTPHQQPHLQQQHQQQQHQQHQQQQQQQQFHDGILYNNPDVGHWEEKFSNVLANVNNAHAAAANAVAMNNLNSNNNQFNMQNLLAATAAGVTGVTQQAQWNFPPNHANAQLQQQQQQQHQQHHHQQQLQAQQQQSNNNNNNNNNNDATMADVIRGGAAVGAVNNADIAGGGEQGPTISNLLNFDSEQLVHINSDEQQMLRLTSDELRLSNLSISS